MKKRWSLHRTPPRLGNQRRRPWRVGTWSALAALCALCYGQITAADSVPPWVQAQVSVPVPPHDASDGAALLYADTTVTVQSDGKLRKVERKVYRILRAEGSPRGIVRVPFDSRTRISLHGWSIPATGKPYEVKDRDAVEIGLPGAEMITDVRLKVLRIPATVPGSIIGYELESESLPYVLADNWAFQDTIAVREAHYAIQLPPGWQYKATWLNHAEEAPAASANRWQWVINNVPAIRLEEQMPPWSGIAAQEWLSFVPSGGQQAGPQSWHDIGTWYLGLVRGRRDASADIKQKVAELTASIPQPLGKMRALAAFVQNDIRYAAVELGVGGYQPHAAAEVFAHRYGDCKDKVTLLSSMLKEIGVDSTYVIVDSTRGSVAATTPANLQFNHVIIAIQLPAGLSDPSLRAVMSHPRLGSMLLFDPTDAYTPFGDLEGPLQGGYGVLITSDGGELVQLPQLASEWNTLRRTAQMTLDESGTLSGDVHEVLTGESAARQRAALAAAGQDSLHVKFVESHVGSAFATFQILKATVGNLHVNDAPLEWNYALEVQHYAKSSGDLLVLRPRILGEESSGLLETVEPRQNPVEFDAAEHNSDVFDIALPPDYEVDDLPPAVDVDYGFASYHSKTELTGHSLRYSRTLDIRELSVPVAKTADLKALYRAIATDERASAVLKRSAPQH